MHRVLWRSAKADLFCRPAQTLLLLAVVLIAAAGITAGLGQRQSAASQWDSAIARANGPDITFYGDGAALHHVAQDPAVRQAYGPLPVTDATSIVVGKQPLDLPLRATAAQPTVGRPLIQAGRWLAGGIAADHEVVLERSFALDKGIHVGDTVTITGPGAAARLRVVGQTVDTIDCFYPQCGSQFGYVTPATMNRVVPITDTADRGNMVFLDLHNRAAVGSFQSAMFDRYGRALRGVNDWQDTRHDALSSNVAFAALLAAFALVLLLAAALVIASSVMARVLARYRELGILKAVGLTPRAVSGLIVGEHAAVAAVGAVSGFAAGCLIAPSMQLKMTQVLGRGGLSFPLSSLLITLVVVEALVTGATLLPAWRAGRISTSRAITQGAAPVRAGTSRLAALAARAHLRAPVVTGLKDAVARPLRAALTVATLVVTVVTIVVAIGFQHTVDAQAANPAVLGDPQQLVVASQTTPRTSIEAALADPRVRSWSTATQRRGSIGGSATFQVRAIGGNIADDGYVIGDGRQLQGPNDALVGYAFLRKFGLDVGGPVTITLSGHPLRFTVVGWYSETEDSGVIAQITMAGLRRAEPSAADGAYVVRLHHAGDAPAVRDMLLRRFGSGVSVQVVSEDFGAIDTFRGAFLAAALLVLLIGLINLVATTLLGIRERLRDLAVLKAIGFTPRQVAESVATTTGALGLLAGVIGVPLGFVLNWALQRNIGTSSGIGPDMAQAPAVWAALLVIPIAAALTAGLGALASRRAARAAVADVLRAE
jgi:putative ABC transport system permease protein